MTLRALVALALAWALLAAVGCGTKSASSPRDDELAYALSPIGGANHGIFVVDREGKHRRRLTRPAAQKAEDVSWSPTSDLLLVTTVSGEIWTIRSDGSELTKIADGSYASWSPDGKRIAVARPDAVEILSADGTLDKKISVKGATGSIAGVPSWSPDGTRLSFAKGTDEQSAIFVAAVSADGDAQLINPQIPMGGYEQAVYWSPDGRLLAFVSVESESRSIWTMRPDGSGRKRAIRGASLVGWAADGGAVLCRGGLRDRPSLHECPLDGGPWRPLGADREQQVLQRGHYSPDRRWLATATSSSSIVVTRADGSRPRVLLHAGSDDAPEWSPDGSRLAFVREAAEDDRLSWIHIVGRDGKDARRIVRGLAAAWLPDGAGLLVRQGEAHSTNLVAVSLEGKARRLAKGQGVYGNAYTRLVLTPDRTMTAYLRQTSQKTSLDTQTIYAIGTQAGVERKVLDVPAAHAGEAAEIGALAWAPDGQTLFGVWALPFTGAGYPVEHAESTLHEVTLSGGSKVLATEVNPYAGVSVSPSGDEVAFAGKNGLEVVDLETGKRRSVVAGEPDAFADPQWSPDGSTLAYLASEGPDLVPTVLETVDADGSGRRRVTTPQEYVYSFSWRPAEATN